MKVLIADDHQILREGLRRILEEASDIRTVGEAENAAQLLSLVRSARWDVVVLDINMPGQSGLEVLKQLKEEYPKLRVLVLSMYPEAQFAVRAMKAGASGYLTKAAAGSQLLHAIRKIHSGSKYISDAVADQLAEAVGRDTAVQPHQQLSDREFQVFKMISAGKTVGEIATELSLSVKTISTYRTKVLQKLNLKHNADIIRYAVEHDLRD